MMFTGCLMKSVLTKIGLNSQPLPPIWQVILQELLLIWKKESVKKKTDFYQFYDNINFHFKGASFRRPFFIFPPVIITESQNSFFTTEITEDTEKIYLFLISYLCDLCGKFYFNETTLIFTPSFSSFIKFPIMLIVFKTKGKKYENQSY